MLINTWPLLSGNNLRNILNLVCNMHSMFNLVCNNNPNVAYKPGRPATTHAMPAPTFILWSKIYCGCFYFLSGPYCSGWHLYVGCNNSLCETWWSISGVHPSTHHLELGLRQCAFSLCETWWSIPSVHPSTQHFKPGLRQCMRLMFNPAYKIIRSVWIHPSVQ